MDGGSGWLFVLDGQITFRTGKCEYGGFSDASTLNSNYLIGAEQALVIGIRFKPGAQSLFCRTPTWNYGQDHVALELSNIDYRALCRELKAKSIWSEQVSMIDRWLLDCLAIHSKGQKTISPIVESVIKAQAPLSSKELGIISGMSQRQLQRHFIANVGMSPRSLGVVCRANCSLNYIQISRANKMSIIDIAQECGYHDQAHMARDFRRLFGNPPSHFIKCKD
tara:strand:+ start:1200 stop:1868 length:669 start_codon:yes stop_codon:yes gene_type:complete